MSPNNTRYTFTIMHVPLFGRFSQRGNSNSYKHHQTFLNKSTKPEMWAASETMLYSDPAAIEQHNGILHHVIIDKLIVSCLFFRSLFFRWEFTQKYNAWPNPATPAQKCVFQQLFWTGRHKDKELMQSLFNRPPCFLTPFEPSLAQSGKRETKISLSEERGGEKGQRFVPINK